MASYTPTNWVAHETLISADRMNNIEQGIAAFYPQETIIAPEQTVTITAETEPLTGVPITLAEGIDLSTFSEADSEALRVSINGKVAPLDAGVWPVLVDGGEAFVSPVGDPDAPDVLIGFSLNAIGAGTEAVLPGDYTVKITKGAPARIPAVAAFPVSAGSGNVMWVIDTPKEDVDAARANGCVLLYAADPDSDAVFAFGCLVGNAMYYYAASGGEFVWNSGTVTLRDGKYAVLDES